MALGDRSLQGVTLSVDPHGLGEGQQEVSGSIIDEALDRAWTLLNPGVEQLIVYLCLRPISHRQSPFALSQPPAERRHPTLSRREAVARRQKEFLLARSEPQTASREGDRFQTHGFNSASKDKADQLHGGRRDVSY